MRLNGLSHLKVATRLTLGFGAMGVLLAVMVAAGVACLRSLDAGTTLIVDDKLPKLELASDTLSQIDNVAIALRNMMLSEDDPPDRRRQLEAMKAARAKAGANIANLQKRMVTQTGKDLMAEVERARAKYIAGQDQLVALINAGRNGEAKNYLAEELRPVLAAYKAAINKLVAHEREDISATGADAKSTSRTGYAALLGIGVAALVMAVGVAVLTLRSLTRQLGGEPGYAVEVTERIAAGDLSTPVRLNARDRASLLFAMERMRADLARIVAQVRVGTGAIATASGQIAAGNQDLSQRTEEQASSLEETAASMEELTGTVKQNAENAHQANQLAQTASQVAAEGGEVVGQVVTTMASINDASGKIADIIGVIDGIAFQTNILALNAAVEAARAGEQGRGFAVVAAEVRSLAQRSATAAKEIKALIDDSVDRVNAGSQLVDRAGDTMQQVVASIKRVTEIMGEIASASQEQTRGIEQVNRAVTQMDEVTQQNASLVEEASAAAQSMREQADQLVHAVSVFKVTAGSEGSAARGPAVGRGTRPSAAPQPIARAPVAVDAAAGRLPPPARSAQAASAAPGDDWQEF